MKTEFISHLGPEFAGFLEFKRALGYKYVRAEYMLHAIDLFVAEREPMSVSCRETVIQEWLARNCGRSEQAVACEVSVLRQWYAYLRRHYPQRRVREPDWPRVRHVRNCLPYLLGDTEVQQLLNLSMELRRPLFRAEVYRALILVLYCTGLRVGEALRLRLAEIDTRDAILFVSESKGRSRWVPFRRSLAKQLDRYLLERERFLGHVRCDYLFVAGNQRRLSVNEAWRTLRKLFVRAGFKPARGRTGPRPTDFRHSFAVQRLTRWYRQGADLHARLPWLSAYMGHQNLLGTETYLTATPELLRLAGHRFHERFVAGRTM